MYQKPLWEAKAKSCLRVYALHAFLGTDHILLHFKHSAWSLWAGFIWFHPEFQTESGKMLVWLCGGYENRCTGNRLEEIMTENKEVHKEGIWKNNSSQDRTGWAIHRAIKVRHPIRLNKQQMSLGREKAAKQFRPTQWWLKPISRFFPSVRASAHHRQWLAFTVMALSQQEKAKLCCAMFTEEGIFSERF